MTRTVALAIAVATLAAARPAFADAKQEALEEMTRAQEALDRGDVEDAIARFGRARDLQPGSSGPYLGLGLANARAGRCDAAVPALEEYLKRKKQNPKPEAQSALDDCKRKLATPPPAPPGKLIVTSEPVGAEVRIDDPGGAPAGVTPFEALLPDGHHRVLVSMAGYETAVREVDGVPGAVERLSVALTVVPAPRPTPPPPPPPETRPVPPAPSVIQTGTLSIDIEPAGNVTVNGVAVAENTKHYEGRFQHGPCPVLVERDGYRSVAYSLQLEAGSTVARKVKLQRLRSGAWLGLAIPMTIIAAASGIAAIVTFYNADGHPQGSDFDTNASANAAMQGIFYPSLALAAAGYLAYGLTNRGKIADGPPLQLSIAPTRSGGAVGFRWRF